MTNKAKFKKLKQIIKICLEIGIKIPDEIIIKYHNLNTEVK